MPTQPLAPTAPVVVAQPVVPLTPEQKLQASMLQLAVTTPVPAQQPAGAIPDPFAGGKPPPVVKHVAMEWATSGDLKAAVDKSPFAPFVSVYSDPGKDDHHAQLIGRGLEVNKVMNRIVPVVNIKPPPVITVAAMSPVFPTPATGPRRIIDTTIVPIEPPVGRHAGWIYNAGNGQVLAIFEDRYGVAHTVKVGDEVDGMRVTSISPNGMVMVNIRTNKESRLMLRGLDASQIRTPVMANPVGTPFGAPIGTPNGTGNGTGAGTPNGGPNVPPWVR